MEEQFVNKVAESGIITIDLETFFPGERTMVFDLKEHLFMGLILKEKDFREALKNTDWSAYQDASVAVTCSADAIIPVWAYMLVAGYLQPYAKEILVATEAELKKELMLKNINAIDASVYDGQRVVIKGCGEQPISEAAYLAITKKLRPFAKSIMYGEPCSTVPIYKKPK